MFQLSKHRFPPTKWKKLAIGLKMATATSTIEANASDVDGRLQALIIQWMADDSGATWQELVNAVIMCDEEPVAEKLAKDVGASCIGTD